MTFGQRVTRAREVLGISIRELARASEVGATTLSEIEAGKSKRPQLSTRSKIILALKERSEKSTGISAEDREELEQLFK